MAAPAVGPPGLMVLTYNVRGRRFEMHKGELISDYTGPRPIKLNIPRFKRDVKIPQAHVDAWRRAQYSYSEDENRGNEFINYKDMVTIPVWGLAFGHFYVIGV